LRAVNETVVLVRPARQGNVGAAARAMANMGLERMILVDPAAPLGDEARAFAFGAGHVLDGAERAPSLAAALAPFARVVGTTSSRNRAVSAPMVTARELPALLPGDAPTALVFGPEASGLTAEELAHCGILVHIPCSTVPPTLNLGQAVLLVVYELHQATLAATTPAAQPHHRAGGQAVEGALASQQEIEGLLAHADELLHAAGFARDTSFVGVRRDLRALAARSALSAHEVKVLRGICRRLGHAIARAPRGE
jgi:tRNA (cytidine32/uridine32-2'-O)-methyltransferase